MRKPNYNQAKRAREENRKKRQIEKRQKKLTRPDETAPAPEATDAKELP